MVESQISSCDSLTNWSAIGDGAVDNDSSDKKEGTASLRETGSTGWWHGAKYTQNLNLSSALTLKFWSKLYGDSDAWIRSMIYSGAAYVYKDQAIAHNTWVEIDWDFLNDKTGSSGTMNYAAVTDIRLIARHPDNDSKWDDLRYTYTPTAVGSSKSMPIVPFLMGLEALKLALYESRMRKARATIIPAIVGQKTFDDCRNE